MIWVLVAIAVVLAAAVAIVAGRLSAANAATRAATRTIEDTKSQLRGARQDVSNARDAIAAAQLEAEAARQAAEHAEVRAQLAESGLTFSRQQAASSTARAYLEALWALACLEQGRAWRLTMAIPDDAAPDDGPGTLRQVVEREIERIREETGTPGRLDAEVPDNLPAADAIVVLRALQGLMAILTRYSDAFALGLALEGRRVVAALTCEGFDGPGTVADEATALLRALGPAGGEIDVSRDEAGRLAARLVIPLLA